MSGSPPAEAVDAHVEVQHRSSGGVAVVSFSRGPHNFLSYGFLERMSAAIESAAEQGARAAVLRTPSRHFCAGADFRGPPSGAAGPSIFDIVPRLLSWPVPVVAAVGGAAVGGGFGLALAADFRVVAAPAYFLANFTRLGITPGFGMTVTLPSLIGSQRAAELLYSSRRVEAEEAIGVGLADRCVDGSELDEQAEAFAAEIALGAPSAIAAVRAHLRSGLVEGLAEALERERSTQERLMATEDFREGVQAWRDRRDPEFAGH